MCSLVLVFAEAVQKESGARGNARRAAEAEKEQAAADAALAEEADAKRRAQLRRAAQRFRDKKKAETGVGSFTADDLEDSDDGDEVRPGEDRKVVSQLIVKAEAKAKGGRPKSLWVMESHDSEFLRLATRVVFSMYPSLSHDFPYSFYGRDAGHQAPRRPGAGRLAKSLCAREPQHEEPEASPSRRL